MAHLIPRCKYIAALFTKETEAKLTHWAGKQGFDLSVSFSGAKTDNWQWHITLMYSVTEHLLPVLGERSLPTTFAVKPTGFELFGEEKDIPVMTLEQSPMDRFRGIYQRIYGMEDKWPEWKPHISLSYKRKHYDVSRMKLPNFPLLIERIKVENVIESE